MSEIYPSIVSINAMITFPEPLNMGAVKSTLANYLENENLQDERYRERGGDILQR